MIRAALKSEAHFISELALRSKAYWGYDEEYIAKCRPVMKIDEAYIENSFTYVYELDGVIIGFYGLKNIDGENRLDHLWLEQDFIGKGFGGKLLRHSMETAKSNGWESYRLVSEPNSVPFYEYFGVKEIGKVQSRLGKDIWLPHMEIQF